MIIKRDHIYLANLDPAIGNEIRKTRPVVIVSNNINNQFSNTITVLPITSSTTRIFPFEVFAGKGIANLPKNSKIKADQIRTIDKSRIVREIGSLPEDLISKTDAAIKVHLST